jgi:Domain of unknown function (DUF4265)
MDDDGVDDASFAVHNAPLARANSLIHVDLADHGMVGKREQLWAWRLGPTEFEVSSIPFFPYGIALGDVVQTRGSGASQLVVQSVASRSGHRVLRFGITSYKVTPELHELLHRELIRSGLKFEWHGAEYAAVDLPSSESGSELIAYLEPLRQRHQVVFELV